MEEIKVIKEDKIKIKKDNDKKVLKKLTKTDEWEKVKDIKEIYDEIRDYDIDKEDIGLNCSKYLNKVGDSGVFEIDELYNTCYRLKALRQKRLKKEKKEKAPKQPKGGRGRGGGSGKASKDTDIDTSKVKDITTQINNSIDKHFNKDTGIFDYTKFFSEISGAICMNGVKNGIKGISKSFKENWDKIDDIGWTGSVWNIGKNTATELMKVVAQCPKQALALAGFTSIASALAYFKGVFGNIVNMVKRIGNPPSTDDDDDVDDDAGSGAVGTGSASGGLSRRTPQSGVLTYSADDVEANRLNQQDLTQNKQSVQEDLKDKFQNIIRQQKENAVRQGRDAVNTIIETDIQSTDAYAPNPERQTTPTTQEPETTEENVIKETETPEETMIRDDMFRPSRGGMFSGMGFDTERGKETGKKFTGRAGGREFLKDAFAAQSLYKIGRKAMDYMGNPLVEPPPQQVPADDGLGFVDEEPQQPTEDTIDEPTKKEIDRQLDNMDNVGKGRAAFLSGAMSGIMGSDASKLAQNAINPAILYLRSQTENPTLKLKSVQSQTEQQTNPETETLIRQMNEELDLINTIIDNPDAKSNEEQTELLQEQQDLMREISTNLTPTRGGFGLFPPLDEELSPNEEEEDIMDFVNRQEIANDNYVALGSLQNEIMDRNKQQVILNSITDEITRNVEERGAEQERERQRLLNNRLRQDIISNVGERGAEEERIQQRERYFQERIRPRLLSNRLRQDILSNIEQRAEEENLTLQPQRQPRELMSRASVQEAELEVEDSDASQISLIPRPTGARGQPPAEWREYFRNMFIRQGIPIPLNAIDFPTLRRLNNSIINDYITELSQVRSINKRYNRLYADEGKELMERLKESKKKK